MYAKDYEVITSLPAGLERADDATLAQHAIYHVRETWPAYDPDTEIAVVNTADLAYDDSGDLPVYVATHGKRALTPQEIAERLATAKAEASADITDAELLAQIDAAGTVAELRAVLSGSATHGLQRAL